VVTILFMKAGDAILVFFKALLWYYPIMIGCLAIGIPMKFGTKGNLGLRREVAEVSIVFGTVLNKNCTTMAVLLVTITVARLLNIPISLTEILMLIPPVLILGLESPGIPGGAGFFMSPIIGVLLAAPWDTGCMCWILLPGF